ncbi:MAG: hypothetical protein QW478_04360 [Candidatus Micrarchaeaceae archaeon]
MAKYIINFLFTNPFKETSYSAINKEYIHNNVKYLVSTRQASYSGKFYYSSLNDNPSTKIYHLYIEIENDKYLIEGDNEIMVNLESFKVKDTYSGDSGIYTNKSFDEFIRPEKVPKFKGIEDIYNEYHQRYPTKSIKEISLIISQEIEKREKNTRIYNQKYFIEYLYKLFLFLPKGVTYGSFCLLKNDKEELIKITDKKSLFVFVLEYFLKDRPIDEILFLFNVDDYNPYDIIINNGSTYSIQDKFNRYLCIDSYKKIDLQTLIGSLSVKKEKDGNYLITGNALNYSVKSYTIVNNEKLNIENWESGTYDYNTMLLILINIIDVTNTKYIIYKHNVMEKDFGLNMVIDDLTNTN